MARGTRHKVRGTGYTNYEAQKEGTGHEHGAQGMGYEASYHRLCTYKTRSKESLEDGWMRDGKWDQDHGHCLARIAHRRRGKPPQISPACPPRVGGSVYELKKKIKKKSSPTTPQIRRPLWGQVKEAGGLACSSLDAIKKLLSTRDVELISQHELELFCHFHLLNSTRQ